MNVKSSVLDMFCNNPYSKVPIFNEISYFKPAIYTVYIYYYGLFFNMKKTILFQIFKTMYTHKGNMYFLATSSSWYL